MSEHALYWLRHVAVLAPLLLGLATPAAAGPPNIVLIMADDLGYGELGCYGATRCQTPRLDQLAATGLRLTDFHSNGSVCSPTRAALMTGRYQQRCGIDGVVTAKRHRDAGMPIAEETLADLLAQAGYATGIFGKWHLGYAPNFRGLPSSAVSSQATSTCSRTSTRRAGTTGGNNNHLLLSLAMRHTCSLSMASTSSAGTKTSRFFFTCHILPHTIRIKGPVTRRIVRFVRDLLQLGWLRSRLFQL
jgi:hypothetical protein